MQQLLEASRTGNATDAETFELLLFRLGGDSAGERSELFGINIFNVREIVAIPPVTAIAGARGPVLGVVNLRGQIVRVLDLPAIGGCVPATGLNIMLVTEAGGATQAFAVEAVEEIVVLGYERLMKGEHGGAGGIIMGIARLDDGRLAQVLDIDTILRQLRA